MEEENRVFSPPAARSPFPRFAIGGYTGLNRGIRNLSLTSFVALCLYGQGTVVEVHKLPSLPLATFQNSYLPGSAPAGANDYTLGGVGSGLFKGPGDGPGVFWMITDRGPNPQDTSSPVRRAFPTPWFNPFILQVRAEAGNGPLTILQALPLTGTDAAGNKVPVTGLPNDPSATSPASPSPLRDERPFTCALGAGTVLSPSKKFTTVLVNSDGTVGNHDGHDTEDVVRDVHNNFWTIEEYGPSISKVDATGRVLKRFVPFGRGPVSGSVEGHFTVVESLPQILGRRPRNRGFEALAITPDQKTLLALVQSPLTNPTTAVGNISRVVRLIVFDVETETPTAEYAYVMQSVDEFAPSPANPTEMKISAMSALDEHRFLIDERTDLVSKLFVVDLRYGTNILGTKWDSPATGTDASLESLAQYFAATPGPPPTASFTTDNLFANGIIELPKQFVADLSKLRNPDGTPFNTPQKIEGMTVLDGMTIAISNDNDFKVQNGADVPVVVDPSCTPSASGVESQLMIIKLDSPIK